MKAVCLKNKLKTKYLAVAPALALGAMQITTTMAEVNTGVGNFKTFVEQFIAPWLIAIGGVVALVGGVMFALGWQRNDSEGKSQGLMVVMTGFMLAGIGGGGYVLFTNVQG